VPLRRTILLECGDARFKSFVSGSVRCSFCVGLLPLFCWGVQQTQYGVVLLFYRLDLLVLFLSRPSDEIEHTKFEIFEFLLHLFFHAFEKLGDGFEDVFLGKGLHMGVG